MSDAFETFWRAYPRRVGKGEARRKFDIAIRKASLSAMLSAIDRYINCKPAWMDFKHPATWLHQECWDDEWDAPSSAVNRTGRRTAVDAANDLIRSMSNEAQDRGDFRDVERLSSFARH